MPCYNIRGQVQMVVANRGNPLVGIGCHVAVVIVAILRTIAVHIHKPIGVTGIVISHVYELVPIVLVGKVVHGAQPSIAGQYRGLRWSTPCLFRVIILPILS